MNQSRLLLLRRFLGTPSPHPRGRDVWTRVTTLSLLRPYRQTRIVRQDTTTPYLDVGALTASADQSSHDLAASSASAASDFPRARRSRLARPSIARASFAAVGRCVGSPTGPAPR